MSLLQNYFLLDPAGGDNLLQSYDPILVLLSCTIAILGAYSTIGLIAQMRRAHNDLHASVSRYWWAAATLSLSGTIFVMHFVGMMALSVPVSIRYDLGVTLLSLLSILAGSAIAIGSLREQPLKKIRLIQTGTLMGLSVALMHYIGMEALIAPAMLRYIPQIWLLSLAISISVSIAAVMLLHWITSHYSAASILKKLSVSILMGGAVASMHYTGMAASEFYSGGTCGIRTGLLESDIDQLQLGIIISILSFIVIGISVLASVFHDRFHQLLLQKNHDLEKRVAARTSELLSHVQQLDSLKDVLDQHAIVSYAAPDGTITYVNEKFCEVSGYCEEELLGNDHRIVKSGDHPPEFYREMWRTITQGKTWHGEITNLKKGGEERYWVYGTIAPMLDSDGNIVQYISIRSDLTDQVLIQQERQKSEEMERLNRAKDEFMASMSHELRTPLTAIIGNSEWLLEQEKSPEKLDVIRSIEISGRNQLALINDILDMSKIEAGKFTIDEIPYDLGILLNDIERMLSVRARDAQINLIIEQKNQEPYQLMGDALRIGQILINLIGNAIKFTTSSGTVKLTASRELNKLVFKVSDTGIGMSEDTLKRVFQRFTQADGSISRRFGGTGLGLYISENLVDIMGGTIMVESTEGEGSTFTVTLPYRRSDVRIAENSRENHSSLLNEQFNGTVLIAEDTKELQLLERMLLESMGVRVEIANNGEEAVQMAQQQHYDLILMDMQMPIMNGLEASRAIRASGIETPIIALTANVMKRHRDDFKQAGGTAFLAKPFQKEELREAIKPFLSLSNQNSRPEKRAGGDRRQQARRVTDHPPLQSETKTSGTDPASEYFQSIKQIKEELIVALANKDWKAMYIRAHNIKGSSAQFGFPSLSKMGAELMQLLDEEDVIQIPKVTMDLVMEISRTSP